MDTTNLTISHPWPLRGPAARALLVSGLWLRAGFVGASLAFIGLIELVGGARSVLDLLLALAGGTLAALAWRRGFAVLERADDAGAAPAPVSRAAPECARPAPAR